MHRYIYIFGNKILIYPIFLLTGFFISFFLSLRNAHRYGYQKFFIFEFWVYFLIFGIVFGGNIGDVLYLKVYTLKSISQAIFSNVGLDSWSIGVSIFLIVFFLSRGHKIEFWAFMDYIFPYVLLILAFTRIGCFMNGCCFGKVCNWCGVRFPMYGFPPVYVSHLNRGLISPGSLYSLPVIPTQLLFSINAFTSFFIGKRLFKGKKRASGEVLYFSLIIYSVGRFFIEFLRYNPPYYYVFPYISRIQLLLGSVIIIATVLRYFLRKRTY